MRKISIHLPKLPKIPDSLKGLRNKPIQDSGSLVGKTCIITGATSGIGLATAQRFAADGAKLILVCRDLAKAEIVSRELQKNYETTVSLVFADFSKLFTVKDAAYRILEEFPSVDILINNAGLLNMKRIIGESGYEETFCVNHLAPFLFTNLLAGRMIESNPARIICLNSEAHRRFPFDLNDYNSQKRRYSGIRAYGTSKSAQLLSMLEIADLLSGTGVTVNAIHPGAVSTNIGRQNGKAFAWYTDHIAKHIMRSPTGAAEAIYHLASSPLVKGISGKYFSLMKEKLPAEHTLDRIQSKAVYDLSRTLTMHV